MKKTFCHDLPPPNPLLTKEGGASVTPRDSFFLFLNKPEGLTSQQCLTRFKKQFGFKKIGHHGTLDPFATGLLLVGVNEATKYFQFIDDSFKTYRATLKLGEATDTLDRTGQVTERKEVPAFTRSKLQSMTSRFVGQHDQEPPMFSAVKVGGKRLYDLARQGKEVERPSRPVEIKDFTIVEWSNSKIVFEVTVSRGTYVRVLADEYARVLGTVGHLIALARTELCGHHLSEVVDLESGDEIELKKIPIEKMLSNLSPVELDERQMRELFFGKKILIDEVQNNALLKTTFENSFLLALHCQKFLGVVQKQDHILKPTRLMSAQTAL